jgi:hypothetical protein
VGSTRGRTALHAPDKMCTHLANESRDRRLRFWETGTMQHCFVAELNGRRHALRGAWERKLRAEPVTSPLANPDTLVLLMDRTLDELFAALRRRCELAAAATSAGEAVALPRSGPRGGCLCGLNPLLAYFRVGAAVISSICLRADFRRAMPDEAELQRCLAEAMAQWQSIAQREIRAFCNLCQTEISRAGRDRDGLVARTEEPPFVVA